MLKKFLGDRKVELEKVEFEIDGMTCDHCATGIQKRVNQLDGIISQEVNYPSGKGTFSYKPEKVSKQQIAATINSMGSYSVKSELGPSSTTQKTEEVTFEIEGMTCDHCATSIEKRFVEKNGVISKSVSYAEGNGVFTYNPEYISE